MNKKVKYWLWVLVYAIVFVCELSIVKSYGANITDIRYWLSCLMVLLAYMTGMGSNEK